MNAKAIAGEKLTQEVLKRYHEERARGTTHQDAWTASVAALANLLNQLDMVVQMEAAERLGKTIDLQTGDPLEATS